MDNDLKYILICIAGIAAIYFLVPRILMLLGLDLARWVQLLIIALLFYTWGQFCMYMKNSSEDDEDDESDK